MFKLLTLFTLLLAASGPDAFQFEYSTRTDKAGKAYLVVRSEQAQQELSVELSGSDGSKLTSSLNVPAGGSMRLDWSQRAGDVRYEVRFGRQSAPAFAFKVRGMAAPSSVQSPSTQDSVEAGKLQMVSSDQDLIKRGQLRYRVPFAIIRYHSTVIGLDGQVLAENKSNGELSYAEGEELSLAWSTDEEVLMIKTRVEDLGGRYAQDIRAPWSFDIPHRDLNFDSGSSKIRPSEAPKLDEAFAVISYTLARLDKAAAAVQGSLPVTLYVVGHTDTVGSSASNQRLSMARAKSIASYFQKKGIWCEIQYAGMGESGLARPTGDNVENEANRRAVYTLALTLPKGRDRPLAKQYRLLSQARPRALADLPALPESFLALQRRKERERSLARDRELQAEEPELEAQGPAPSPRPVARVSSPEQGNARKAAAPRAPENPPTLSKSAPGAHGKDCSLRSEKLSGAGTAVFLLTLLALRRKRRGLRRESWAGIRVSPQSGP